MVRDSEQTTVRNHQFFGAQPSLWSETLNRPLFEIINSLVLSLLYGPGIWDFAYNVLLCVITSYLT